MVTRGSAHLADHCIIDELSLLGESSMARFVHPLRDTDHPVNVDPLDLQLIA